MYLSPLLTLFLPFSIQTKFSQPECRAAKQAGIVKQSKQEVKAAKAKKRNEWIGGLIHAEVAQRASQLAANSPGQAAPSAANNNVDPQDAAKDSDTDPNAAKDSESGG
ncbi:hypothetical protein KCV07_g1388, partial [Aureobasidium melanogenum]